MSNHSRYHRRQNAILKDLDAAAAARTCGQDLPIVSTQAELTQPENNSVNSSIVSNEPPSDTPVSGAGLFEVNPEDNHVDNIVPEEDHEEITDPDKPSPSETFISIFRELHQNFTLGDWDTFLDALDDYINFAQDHVKLPPLEENERQKKQQNPRDPRYIQRLYRHNRRRAVRLICNETKPRCDLPAEDLANHFFPPSPPVPPEGTFVHPSPAPSPPDCNPFSPEEVWGRLRRAENTSPGPDRLTYQHWRGVDPGGRALSIIYNICMKAGKLPESWKTSNTILLPKNDDMSNPADWRPICLSSTISKIFCGCVARRIQNWNSEFKLLSDAQKGFLPFDGAFENHFILNQRIQKARHLRQDLCLMSIDFKNAFGSIAHSSISDALREAGIGPTYLKIIESLYEGSTTCFLTQDGTSCLYSILSGVRQGCPVSGILFIFVLDPLLKKLQGLHSNYRCLAFCDDVFFIADTPEELQSIVDSAESISSQIGLRINAEKCFSLHIGANPVGCRETQFTIGGVNVPILRDAETAKFLGKPIGFGMVPSSKNFQEFINCGDQIMSSFLAPWQKIDAMKTFFYPALAYAQRTAQFPKTDWNYLDELMRPSLKKTLYLPTNASNDYLYGNQQHGFLGIPMAGEDSDIAAIDGAFKLLTSIDPIVRGIAWEDLRFHIRQRIKDEPNSASIAEFLSGSPLPGTNPISSVWANARSASRRLGVEWDVNNDLTISIKCGDMVVLQRHMIFKTLRTVFKNRRSANHKNKPHQGKTSHCFSRAKASTHFHHSGDFTRFADWKFVHKARLGLVPLNGYQPPDSDEDSGCRRCGYRSETLPHVICHCKRYFPAITKRHNSIVNRLKKAAGGRWEILSENRPIAGSTLRPDLVLVKGESCIILDVTVTFENGPEAFPTARIEKTTKYDAIRSELRNRYKDTRVEAVVVGALGSWDPANDKVISRLCSKKYANLMRKLIVSDTIRASRMIFMEHLSGERQIDMGPQTRYIIPSNNASSTELSGNTDNAGTSRYGPNRKVQEESNVESNILPSNEEVTIQEMPSEHEEGVSTSSA